MRKLSTPYANAEFVTLEQASKITSLGVTKVRMLANQCGASRKIGKSYRINRRILIEYIDSFENSET